jgi:hypothetical protein
MMEIETKLQEFLQSPFDNLKQNYEEWISLLEYDILSKCNEVEYKSREWFDIRINAFSIRKKAAMIMLLMWIDKYGSTVNCPVQYQNTLNIPFKQIKEPK